MTKDLTSGSPLKVILLFSLPLVLGNLFQQFYALADTIIVGRFCGVSALASVGATGSVNYLILGFVIGVCNGFAIPIAQLFGARDYSDLRRHVANAAWLCIAASVVLTISTVALTRPMMQLMQTPDDIIDGAVIYIAALAGVSPDLHEAATIDGATRLQRIIHINLPAIMPTIVIMLIMAVGGIMNLSFEKVLLMQTDSNTAVSEVISTYVYKLGIQRAQYSLSAAVGLFNNIINLILLVTVNKVSRKISETSLW